jgi:hypothetical protein
MSENVQIADNLRDGLVDIGVTAATQSGNFKQAVAQMILSLIQLITKLELTKIAQDALGESGTPLSFLGSLFGGGGSSIEPVTVTPSVFGTFAKGGVFVPGRGAQPLKRFAGGGISTSAAIFGEAGAEAAVPLPDGRRIPVELRIPNIPNAGVGAGPAITVIHDGSTDIAIQRMRNNNIRVIARQIVDDMTPGIVGKSVASSAAAAPSITAQVNKNPRRRTIA